MSTPFTFGNLSKTVYPFGACKHRADLLILLVYFHRPANVISTYLAIGQGEELTQCLTIQLG